MIRLLLLSYCSLITDEQPVMGLSFVDLSLLFVCFSTCPFSVVLLGMPLKAHVDQLASKLQQSARDTRPAGKRANLMAGVQALEATWAQK